MMRKVYPNDVTRIRSLVVVGRNLNTGQHNLAIKEKVELLDSPAEHARQHFIQKRP